MNAPVCMGCGLHPDEINEYIEAAVENDMLPDEYVCMEEGTYNPTNGHFLCTECYIAAGCPSSPRGWKCP